MNFSIIRIASLALGLACASVTHAAVQARFHLPVTAQWGHTVLTPGDYNIRISNDFASGKNQILVEGEGKLMLSLPITVDVRATGGRSTLELVDLNGTYYVREYRSSASGKNFTFSIPKHAGPLPSKSVEIAN